MVFTIHKSDGCRGSPATILSFQFYPPCYPPPFRDVRVKSISYSKIKRRRVNDRLSPTNSNKLVKNSLVIYLQTVRTIEFPLEFHNFDKRMKSNEESFVKIFLIKDPTSDIVPILFVYSERGQFQLERDRDLWRKWSSE